MEEAKRLQTKFYALMEDFCVPFDTTLVEDFKELDFRDEYTVNDFLTRLRLKETHLEHKLIILRDVANLAHHLQWIAKLDDTMDDDVPFQYLHIGADAPLSEIETHYISITNGMRYFLEKNPSDLSVKMDLALCEKAFQRIKQIRGR